MNLCPSFIPSSQFCYMWTKCKYDDCLSQQGLQEKSAGSIRRSSGHVLTSAVRYMLPLLRPAPVSPTCSASGRHGAFQRKSCEGAAARAGARMEQHDRGHEYHQCKGALS